MKETILDTGARFLVGTKEELYDQAAVQVAEARSAGGNEGAVVACSGGSTPQDWYRWCVQTRALSAAAVAQTHFTVSDERCVPLADPQSNFGHADRLLLDPLGVPRAHRHPWAVDLTPPAAVAEHRATIASLAGPGRAYDLCFLGLGDDSHTASLFPGSPLLDDDQGELFATIEVPRKGWRLTITPAGLRACQHVVVLALGAGKAPAVRRVFREPFDPVNVPTQILQKCGAKVLWLLDEAAAAGMGAI